MFELSADRHGHRGLPREISGAANRGDGHRLVPVAYAPGSLQQCVCDSRSAIRKELTRRGGQSAMRSGFTLIEICVATVIIGVAVTALMTGIASGTRVNDAGQNLTEAIFLTQEVRECTLKLPYSSVAGLGGTTYSPPIDGRGQTIGQLSGWSQAVAVAYMNPASPTTVSGGPSDVILVTVTISRNNAQVMSTSWLVARKIGE